MAGRRQDAALMGRDTDGPSDRRMTGGRTRPISVASSDLEYAG